MWASVCCKINGVGHPNGPYGRTRPLNEMMTLFPKQCVCCASGSQIERNEDFDQHALPTPPSFHSTTSLPHPDYCNSIISLSTADNRVLYSCLPAGSTCHSQEHLWVKADGSITTLFLVNPLRQETGHQVPTESSQLRTLTGAFMLSFAIAINLYI